MNMLMPGCDGEHRVYTMDRWTGQLTSYDVRVLNNDSDARRSQELLKCCVWLYDSIVKSK